MSSAPVLVKPNSHRARRKMFALLGYEPAAYYSWERKGNFFWIPAEAAQQVLSITGVTRSRDKGDLKKCWGTSVRISDPSTWAK